MMRRSSENSLIKRPLFPIIGVSLALNCSLAAAPDADNFEEDSESLLLIGAEEEGFLEEDSFLAAAETNATAKQHSQYPSSRAINDNGWGIVLWGDFLYWKTLEGGLSYALPSPNYTFGPPRSQLDTFKGVNGKVTRLSPEYKPGFRLGLDLELPKDDWDLRLSWTSYHNSHSSSVTAPGNQVIFPFWINLNGSGLALAAKAELDLHFNALELAIGRSTYVGKYLSIRPFAGFQAAWIEQDFNVEYASVFFANQTTTPEIHVKNRSASQGYGLKMGMDTKWELGWGFSIEGDVAASLLWTDFDLGQYEKNGDKTPRSTLKDDFELVTAVVDLFGGLAWEWRFHNDRFYVQLHGGWEEQLWFSQNQWARFVDSVDYASTQNLQSYLSFSGWTIGAKFGF